MTTNNDKLTANNFDPKKGYTADYRGETIKIIQNGKTAEFKDFKTSESFIKTSNHTVR